MKNKILIIVTMVLIVAIILGVIYLVYTKNIVNNKEVANIENYKYSETEREEETVKDAVMINGKIYYSTGEKSTITARCGVMDGRITATVEKGELPTENNESNFGIDYGYQFVDENTVDIRINNEFIVFKAE